MMIFVRVTHDHKTEQQQQWQDEKGKRALSNGFLVGKDEKMIVVDEIVLIGRRIVLTNNSNEQQQ